MPPKTIQIEGKEFRFVQRGRRGDVDVYTSGNFFVRVGTPSVIEKMLAIHKRFNELGFPVAKIVGEGRVLDQAYFMEESLGEKFFSHLFKDDCDKKGQISTETFEEFVKISENFAAIQLKSTSGDRSLESFENLIDYQSLVDELPEFSEKIITRYDYVLKSLKDFPTVLTHGDFNPHNLFPKGCIDFEEIYYGPAGYDLVTNIFHVNYLPVRGDYEYTKLYDFTDQQVGEYYRRLDQIYLRNGRKKISDHKKDFEFLRAVWLTARNRRSPKLQQWRYDLFKKQFLL